MAANPTIFISYSRANRAFVERLNADLQALGLTLWLDREGLKAGTLDWEQVLREAIRDSAAVLLIASPASRQSRYVRGELDIAEMYARPVFPVWAEGEHWADCVPIERIKTQYVDARTDRYADALNEIIDVLQAALPIVVAPTAPVKADSAMAAPVTPIAVPIVPTATTTPIVAMIAAVDADLPSVPPVQPTIRNPYKGLRAFSGADSGDFFGREGLIKELTALIDRMQAESIDPKRMMVVVGPSGSGKSSVVMAGLLPALQNGALPGSDHWLYLDPIVPGTHPVESLIVAFAGLMPSRSLTSIQADLDSDSTRGLHLLARALLQQKNTDPSAKVVLMVDQFEELFTLTLEEDERQHFIDLLISAATEPRGTLIVLLTLRADFYDRPMAYPALGRLIEAHSKSVLPLGLDDLRAVIEKPAGLPDVGLTFDDGLIGDLLFEVRGEAAPLPLLQFALDQLFDRREGQRLTRTAYNGIGGVRGALAKHAEATYTGLPSDEHRRLTRSLFLRLIEPGATAQDTTRRRAALSELTLVDPAQSVLIQRCAETFVAARLLTTSTVAQVRTIEVSHEALIREWGRLSDWLHEAREDIYLQQALARDAASWRISGQRTDDVYRGQKLIDAQGWAARNVPNADEMAFIEAGLAHQKDQAAAERDRHERELNLAKAALANAQRAEAAEKDRAIRFEQAARRSTRIARLSAVAAGVAIGGVIFIFIYANHELSVLTARADTKINADRAIAYPLYTYLGLLIAYLSAMLFGGRR